VFTIDHFEPFEETFVFEDLGDLNLILELGIATWAWPASTALRMRVNISAIGSVNDMIYLHPGLPGCLYDAGDFALQRQFTETNAAQRPKRRI
jgi:hypothetical protein